MLKHKYLVIKLTVTALFISFHSGSAQINKLSDFLSNIERDVIILGEIHGTAEGPEFFLDLIDAAIRTSGKPVVGLELPRVDRVDLCDPLSRNVQVLETAMWIRPFQDGRTSVAMHDLLCRLFEMQYDNLLDIIFLENQNDVDINTIRFAIEGVIKELENNDRDIYILMGNYHSRVGSHVSSFAQVLSDNGIDVLSLTVTALRANIWACASELQTSCGVRSFEANFCDLKEGDERPLILKDLSSRRTTGFPWDGCFNIVEATPSPPMFP